MLSRWRINVDLIYNKMIVLHGVKSDRINALKKKYDAYLEEDKKRKERNEYILEKLDKMRCCTALVQVRHKPSLVEGNRKPANHNNQHQPYNLSNQTLESLSYQPIPSSNQTYFPPDSPQLMDESILQELSKKYILIPKSRPVHNNYLLKMKSEKDESNDWKSKYDILEQLKKTEKEETVSIPPASSMFETGKNTKPTEDYEPQISFSSEQSHHDNYYNDNDPDKEVIVKLDQDVGIHETNNQEIVYQYDNFNNIVSDETTLKQNVSTTDDVSSSKGNIDSTKGSEYIDLNAQEFCPVPDNENTVTQYQYAPDDISNVREQYINEEITNVPVDNEQYFPSNIEDENEYQTIHPNDFVKEINNDMAHETIADTGEHLDYPVEIINAQDFTPHDDVHVEDGVNINPEQLVMQAGGDSSTYNTDQLAFANNDKEKSDNNFDPIVVTDDTDLAETASVETYAENVDNYYDEQPNENYTYNEDNVVDENNAEYPAQNQNYNQEEYTAYYEGAQTEQPYTIEANENDATLQQYDQNYQQQYSTDYNPQDYQQGYEQQYAEQGYEQNEYIGQQATEEENSQQETVLYEIQGETPKDVEQVLDNEEGYIVEKQDAPIEISGVEKTLNQQPSPNTTDQHVNKAQ